MFGGSSRARKGKITAEDHNWRDQKEQGSLTSYFNQPARNESLVCLWKKIEYILKTSL